MFTLDREDEAALLEAIAEADRGEVVSAEEFLRELCGASRRPLASVVAELRDLLGLKLVAYISGVKETRVVREWAEGSREPRSPVPDRLRLALQVALLLREHESVAVVQAWFQGMNPLLDDRAPARVLREDDLAVAGPQVLSAARAFVTP
jgi:hypothetical protein